MRWLIKCGLKVLEFEEYGVINAWDQNPRP